MYEDSTGTLNDFLGAMTEDDAVRGTAPFD
ncbi:hypothetical protein [Escherichia coli]